MRLLLDTHVWLWRLLTPERLSDQAEAAIVDRENELFLSPISTWETLVLARKGGCPWLPPPASGCSKRRGSPRLLRVPVTHEIALRTERLEGLDLKDTADRFLVATALEHRLTLVTAARAIQAFGTVPTLW